MVYTANCLARAPGTDSEIVGGIATVEVGDTPYVVGQTTVGRSVDTAVAGGTVGGGAVVGGTVVGATVVVVGGTVVVVASVAGGDVVVGWTALVADAPPHAAVMPSIPIPRITPSLGRVTITVHPPFR